MRLAEVHGALVAAYGRSSGQVTSRRAAGADAEPNGEEGATQGRAAAGTQVQQIGRAHV